MGKIWVILNMIIAISYIELCDSKTCIASHSSIKANAVNYYPFELVSIVMTDKMINIKYKHQGQIWNNFKTSTKNALYKI